jgi:hypothetical protein
MLGVSIRLLAANCFQKGYAWMAYQPLGYAGVFPCLLVLDVSVFPDAADTWDLVFRGFALFTCMVTAPSFLPT